MAILKTSDPLDDLDSRGKHIVPTFAFVDPFGFKGAPFQTVQRLLSSPKTEVFVNIMQNYINRFLEHPDATTRQHIIDLFGTDEVLNVAQHPTNRIHNLRMLYQKQLLSCASYVRYFEMRDSRNKPIYDLFFASKHPLGHAKMKESFWAVNPSSGFNFSDATDPSQLVLFKSDVIHEVAAVLLRSFARKTLPIKEVILFIENETPYTASHAKKALRLLEDESHISVRDIKTDGTKRINHKYPENAVIEFL